MDEFVAKNKLWPSGESLDIDTDSQNITVPISLTRQAPSFVSSIDGTQTFQFLFWNTGRHLTPKRRVRWNFSVGGWGVWTATAWYGTPPRGSGPGAQRVRVDPFGLTANGPLGGGTAIDGPASTFAAGAFPFNGNDREIGTAGASVSAVAKDVFSNLQFAGWLRLIWGGDSSGEFVETDTGESMGSSGFFEHSSGPFNVARGAAVDLLASYGNSVAATPPWMGIFKDIYKDLGIRVPLGGDPGPEDITRLREAVVKQLLDKTRPVQPVGTDFQRFIDTAKTMKKEELTRARQSVQTSLDLGKTALGVLDAQIKRGPGR